MTKGEGSLIAIHIDVITRLDERAIAANAAELETAYGEAGAKASAAFDAAMAAGGKARMVIKDTFVDTEAQAAEAGLKARTAYDVAFARASARFDAKAMHANLIPGAEQAGEQAGLGYVGKLMHKIESGLNAETGSFKGMLSTGGMLSEAGEAGGAMGAAFAGALVVAVDLEMAKLTLEIGEHFEEMERTIAIHTTASGAQLEGMTNAAYELSATLDTSTKDVASDMAMLSTRLNASGEDVKALTGDVEMLRDRWGSLSTDALSGAFVNFGLNVTQSEAALASLDNTARITDTDLGTLANETAAYSSIAQEVNLTIEEEGRLLGDLHQKHIDVGKAMSGLEVAEKALAKENQDRRKAGQPEEQLPDFIQRATQAMEIYGDKNSKYYDEQKADEIALDVFGQRRWAEAKRGAEAYLAVVQAGQQAVTVDDPGGYLAKRKKDTEDLKNLWNEVKNAVADAFRPVAIDILKQVKPEIEALASFLSSHKEMIADIFKVAWIALQPLWAGIAVIPGALDNLKRGAEVVGDAFSSAFDIAKRAIEVVKNYIESALKPEIDAVKTLLEKIGSIAGPVGDAMANAFTKAAHALEALIPQLTILERIWDKIHGGGDEGPGKVPEIIPNAPAPPGPPAPPLPGAPPMTPEELEPGAGGGKGKKGPRLPEAPEVPYGPGYGGPPEVGETEEHYKARMSLMEKQHELATDQARLNQLEHDNNATQDDIQKVKNKILKDQVDINAAEAALNKSETDRMKKHAGDLEQIGASIDKDFGISKGLAGIAENLFKFLADLAMAPVLGALGGVALAGGAGSGTKGVGLAGMALSAAFPGLTGGGTSTSAGTGSGGMVWNGSQWVSSGGGSGGVNAAASANNYGVPGAPSPATFADVKARSMVGLPYTPGTADCSGYVSAVYTAMGGTGGHFTTYSLLANPATYGFHKGYMPGALNVGVDQEHMAATLPNGVNIESGGGTGGGPTYGGKARGAMDPQFGGSVYWFYPGYSSGGEVVPIAAHSGEWVIQKSAVDHYGPSFMDAINGRQFQGGGAVDIHSPIGGGEPPKGLPGGGQGIAASGSGLLGAAISSGAMGGATMGMGIAAQVAMQEINRAIQYGGQVAGIAMGGLMETFLPTGASQLAQNSWLTRIAGGLAGAGVMLPNTAGQLGGSGAGSAAPTPESVLPGSPAPGGGQTNIHNGPIVHIENIHDSKDPRKTADVIGDHLHTANLPPGMR